VLRREKFKAEYQTLHPSKLARALLYPSLFPPAIPSHLGMKKLDQISNIEYCASASLWCVKKVLAAPQVPFFVLFLCNFFYMALLILIFANSPQKTDGGY
jgi:hypothetical protein